MVPDTLESFSDFWLQQPIRYKTHSGKKIRWRIRFHPYLRVWVIHFSRKRKWKVQGQFIGEGWARCRLQNYGSFTSPASALEALNVAYGSKK